MKVWILEEIRSDKSSVILSAHEMAYGAVSAKLKWESVADDETYSITEMRVKGDLK